jgi:hypothetical protein
MNLLNLQERGRVIAHERTHLRARGFEFCDSDADGAFVPAPAQRVPAYCRNLVSRVVLASTEDQPDQIGRALAAS